MPAPTPLILGPDGQPVSTAQYDYGRGWGGYGGRFLEATNQGNERPYWPVTLDSINRLVPQNEFRATVAICDKLIANTDVIKGALRSKADYVVGDAFLPQFNGAAKAWGAQAEKWLREQFYPIANLDGDAMSEFRSDLAVGSVRIDAAGSFGVLLTEYDGGFPAVQYVPTWRLFNGDATGNVVTALRTEKSPDGAYLNDAKELQDFKLTGQLLIYNGIIYNPVGMRRLYYRLRLENNENSGVLSNDYLDIHASDFIYAYEREFHDGISGWPTISASVGKLRDALQSHEWEQLSMLAHSALVFTEDNETGTAPAASDSRALAAALSGQGAGASGPPGMSMQSLMGGLIRYFKANSGSKLSSFESKRPGDSWENIQDRIYDASLRGAGWPLMGWGCENPGGQMARGSQGVCRCTISRRQRVLGKVAKRVMGWAASKGIKIKALPEYPGDDLGGQLLWSMTFPALMSIDDGRDSQNRRDDFDKGFGLMSDVLADKGSGLTEEQHWERRANSAAIRKLAAYRRSQQADMKTAGLVVDDRDMSALSVNEQPSGDVNAGETNDAKDASQKGSQSNEK